MKYTLDLTVEDETAYRLLFPDNNEPRNERSTRSLSKEKGKTKIHIEARDPVALQASVNGIIKLLRAHDSARGAIDEFS